MVKKNPSKRVWINGTDVERKYAKEMLAEVVLHKWNRVKIDAHIGDHTHCCMCEIAMGVHRDIQAFTNGNWWLCDACWARFIHYSDTI